MAECSSWRSDLTVVVAHPHESLVWVDPEAGPALHFELDDYLWFPDVAPVLTSLRSRWAIDAVVRRCLAFRIDKEECRCWLTFLVEPRAEHMPDSGQWRPITAVDPATAPDDAWPLVTAALHESVDTSSPIRRPWALPGWFEEAVAWSEDALRAHGIEPTGPPEQLRTWGLSTVVLFGTPDGNVYFKAAVYSGPDAAEVGGFLFANEAQLLTGLTVRQPDYLPAPIAVDPQRVWMLLPDAGAFLYKCNDLDVWERAIRQHARHQRAYVGHAGDLFRIGCLDRRLERLAAQFDGVLHDPLALSYLDAADRDRLHAAAPGLRAMIAELVDLGIPDTLVHGDLHGGNIGVRDGNPITFDWTDACVSHPFLDLVTFMGESRFLDATPGARDRLHAAYLAEWSDLASERALARALVIIQTVGALHQAVSYQRMLPNLDEPDRSSMGRGGAFWMKQSIQDLQIG